jgi:ABC-type transport system involved in multi-copper enzyme maturation permease subunit
VFLEAIRRREISAVFLFMGLFIAGAITARFVGSETDAAASFILNLGLSLSWFLSLIVSILLAARQFPDELEHRSIYPLLAKPVTRVQYLAGKWLAVTLAGCATALVLNVLAMAASPWPESVSIVMILQGMILEIMAIATAVAIAIALSIRLPKALAVVITALLAFAATPLVTMIRSMAATTGLRDVVRWLTGYIPDFGRLDLVNAITIGMPAIGAVDFFARFAYALIITTFSLSVAMLLLERKPL